MTHSKSKIFIGIVSFLAIVSLFWVAFQTKSETNEEMYTAPSVNFIIYFTLIIFTVAMVLFTYYKIRDLYIHPSSLRELIIISAIVLVGVVVGFAFGGSEPLELSDGTFLNNPTESRWIGMSIVASLVLTIIAFIFLLVDALKGVFN